MSFDKAYGDAGKSTHDVKVEEAAKDKAKAETVDRLAAVLEQLVTSSRQQGLSAEQLETLLTRVGMTSAEAMRLSLKPENTEPSNLSAYFTPEDLKKYGSFANKPTLTRKTFFCGTEEKENRLTPAEIEAYNAITTTRDARNGQWKADLKQQGREQILEVTVPYQTIDQRMELPSLLLLLLELNGGPSTADIHALLAEVTRLKRLAGEVTRLKRLATSYGATAQELEASMLSNA